MGDNKGTLQIDFDVISLKTKLILTRLGITYGTLLMKKAFLIQYYDSNHIWIINLLKLI